MALRRAGRPAGPTRWAKTAAHTTTAAARVQRGAEARAECLHHRRSASPARCTTQTPGKHTLAQPASARLRHERCSFAQLRTSVVHHHQAPCLMSNRARLRASRQRAALGLLLQGSAARGGVCSAGRKRCSLSYRCPRTTSPTPTPRRRAWRLQRAAARVQGQGGPPGSTAPRTQHAARAALRRRSASSSMPPNAQDSNSAKWKASRPRAKSPNLSVCPPPKRRAARMRLEKAPVVPDPSAARRPPVPTGLRTAAEEAARAGGGAGLSTEAAAPPAARVRPAPRSHARSGAAEAQFRTTQPINAEPSTRATLATLRRVAAGRQLCALTAALALSAPARTARASAQQPRTQDAKQQRMRACAQRAARTWRGEVAGGGSAATDAVGVSEWRPAALMSTLPGRSPRCRCRPVSFSYLRCCLSAP